LDWAFSPINFFMPENSATLPAHDVPPAPERRGGLGAAAKLNLALAGLLWVWLAGELWFEWSVSDQYAYGLFVPFLMMYLIWLRAEDQPAPKPWRRADVSLAAVAIVALAQYPIAVIFSANADWRLLAWSEALLALVATIALLGRWGGWPWVRHFLPAFLFFLFAVPWPSLVEITLVDHLMNFVATVVAEVLNLMGYNAERVGHIIYVHGTPVLVEEACSGVRSIQSTIMAGWLVGEWWRFRTWGRAGLLAWAALISVIFNLLRTFILAWITATSGPVAMEHWHDTTGYLVFALSFTTVLVGAWLARPRKKIVAPSEPIPYSAPGWLPQGAVIGLLVLLAGAWPASTLWYAARAANVADKPTWKLNLATAAPAAKAEALSADLRQVLFYNDGIQAAWKDAGGHEWRLFNLQWTRARAAQLGGVHSPESCLPAVGWVKQRQGENLVWRRGGIELVFNTYEFAYGDQHAFVFYGQWDPAGYRYYEKTGRERGDRLIDAWNGDRKEGKQLLEVAISDAASMEEAADMMRQFLDRGIVEVAPTAGTK
jgi:exosortase